MNYIWNYFLALIKMKAIVTIFFLFVICLTVSAQDATRTGTKKVIQSEKKVSAKTLPLPADDKDPVCFMKVKKGSLITSLYKGKLYGFCSEHCKAVFLANPEEQLKPVIKNN
jgi:YHS domain-containing protein